MSAPRALMISDSALGDLVSSSIVIDALAATMPVDLVTRPDLRGFGAFLPGVRVVDFDFAKTQDYDHVVDLTSSSRTRARVRLIRAATKWGRADGFWNRMKARAVYDRVVTKAAAGNIVRDYDALLIGMGLPAGAEPKLVAPVRPKLPWDLDALGPYVVLHVGAGNPLRVLPENLVLGLGREARAAGRALILVGTEAGAAGAINAALGGFALYADLDLPQLAVVLEKAHRIVAPDSGPFHLAMALGANVTGVYGPNLAARAAPPRALAEGRIVENAWPCRPCDQNRDCPYDIRCLRSVAIDQIRNWPV